MVINIHWRSFLLDNPVTQDHNLVRHGHGFNLVMGHIDRGGFQPLMQILDFGAHLHPELCIEV